MITPDPRQAAEQNDTALRCAGCKKDLSSGGPGTNKFPCSIKCGKLVCLKCKCPCVDFRQALDKERTMLEKSFSALLEAEVKNEVYDLTLDDDDGIEDKSTSSDVPIIISPGSKCDEDRGVAASGEEIIADLLRKLTAEEEKRLSFWKEEAAKLLSKYDECINQVNPADRDNKSVRMVMKVYEIKLLSLIRLLFDGWLDDTILDATRAMGLAYSARRRNATGIPGVRVLPITALFTNWLYGRDPTNPTDYGKVSRWFKTLKLLEEYDVISIIAHTLDGNHWTTVESRPLASRPSICIKDSLLREYPSEVKQVKTFLQHEHKRSQPGGPALDIDRNWTVSGTPVNKDIQPNSVRNRCYCYDC